MSRGIFIPTSVLNANIAQYPFAPREWVWEYDTSRVVVGTDVGGEGGYTYTSGGTGENNVGANVGTGIELYKNKVGLDLNFRSLVSSDSSIQFTQNVDEIDIVANPSLVGDKMDKLVNVNTQANSYTILVTDSAGKVLMNSASGTTVTLPNGFDTGFQVAVTRLGTGNVTIAATGTLLADGTQIGSQHTGVICTHIGSNQWLVEGNLA